MVGDADAQAARTEEAWREHNLSQLLYFRSLSLREKLEAVEGMAEIVRLLERMRAEEKWPTAARQEPQP
jgi:hypothetical protein